MSLRRVSCPARRGFSSETVHLINTVELWKHIGVKLVSIDPCDDKTVALVWPGLGNKVKAKD